MRTFTFSVPIAYFLQGTLLFKGSYAFHISSWFETHTHTHTHTQGVKDKHTSYTYSLFLHRRSETKNVTAELPVCLNNEWFLGSALQKHWHQKKKKKNQTAFTKITISRLRIDDENNRAHKVTLAISFFGFPPNDLARLYCFFQVVLQPSVTGLPLVSVS